MAKRTCSFSGCDRPHEGHGLCAAHLLQQRRGKELSPLKIHRRGATCSYDGCGKPHLAHGLCDGHLKQQASGIPLHPLRSYNPGALCSADDCNEPALARSWCSKHYKRVSAYGDPGGAPDSHGPDLPGESWLPVVNWESLYEVSDFGRVRSLPRLAQDERGIYRLTPGHLLKPAKVNKWGHRFVSLSLNGHVTQQLVHRLVLAAFVGPCPEGQETRHWDGDAANNHLSNLLYGTHKENEEDKKRYGALKKAAA